jgi:hypothetical protein
MKIKRLNVETQRGGAATETECSRPRLQQRAAGGRLVNNPAHSGLRMLLRPGTGALRPILRSLRGIWGIAVQRTPRFAEGGNFSCHAENLDKPGHLLRASPRSPRLCVEKTSSLQPLAFSLQPSQRGVALVITLILLSVVTFMAITFLALSRRERSAVTTVTDTASARLAADAALANAEAQVMANVLSTTNPYNFTLLVSTNYINPNGFVNGSASPTNVNYDFVHGGGALNQNQFLQNLINLLYSPRPPVFISTNSAGSNDFRFYLDLNRNGRFDANGLQIVISPDPATPYYDTNGNETAIFNPPNVLSNVMVGDPEWIGVLERPDAPYGPNNKFVARYAFIAVPVGNTLDLNAIHNQALTPPLSYPMNPMNPLDDGYFRNQGVGSWEINLAAFLADLNTNEWDNNSLGGVYQYRQVNLPNQGAAFNDAFSILGYRYYNNYSTLATADNMFARGLQVFPYDNIDGYSDGPLQTGFQLPGDIVAPQNDNPDWSWAGADNTNHFFSHQELFNSNEISVSFVNRLLAAGQTNSTYDRYTFYRLLSQLGTDSAPESGKMNINYDNLNPYVDTGSRPYVTNSPSATNFLDWTPLGFFTNAADRLLRAYTTQWRNSNPTNFAATFYSVTNFNFDVTNFASYPAFGIGHIPVLVSNQFVYTPAVNRLLQLAANIYEAAMNGPGAEGSTYPYPSVFRPTFWVTNENGFHDVYINGYQSVFLNSAYNPITTDPQLSQPREVTSLPLGFSSVNFPDPLWGPFGGVNVYGVPWIIGAKKGFPNFNKFGIQNTVQITRKLQIKRNKIPIQSVLTDFDYTNQLYVFNVSNSIGVECWNSYSNAYTNQVQIVVNDNISMMLANSLGAPTVVFNTYPAPYPITTNINLSSSWPGSAPWGSQPNSSSFIVPITNTIMFLTNSAFYFGTTPPGATYKGFYPVGDNLGWETNKTDFRFPQFSLFTTNRLQVFMLDQDVRGNYHVIDYVQFAGPDSSRDLNAEIQTNVSSSGYAYMWSTNLNVNGVPWGIISQIDVSEGQDSGNWDSYWNNDPNRANEILGFTAFMTPNGQTSFPGNSTANSYATNYIVQVPYTPTITTYEYTSWQANDPLVHYLTSDLNFYGTEAGGDGPTTGANVLTNVKTPIPRPSFDTLNERYQPWGRIKQLADYQAIVDQNPSCLAFKDPLVRYSDNWDFPTNKFPTVGWLGRVHRGTPWQTVFLKATNILSWVQNHANGVNTWEYWTGNYNPTNTAYTAPVQDRLLFDLFTTTFNDNATRGTLSVNVGAPNGPSLAAWSALFSGLVTVSNNASDLAIRPSVVSQTQTHPPAYTATNIFQPAGPYNPALPLAQQPPLVQIVQGINNIRATFTNADGLVGTFEHVGDILSVPQLTEQSPFLNRSSGTQLTNGISDEMYEWLPQQTMSLLRASGSPRYVIYCYGQALKPAPNSIVTSGSFFGMVTNYQVVSEIATRAVVRFNSAMTNVIVGTNNLVVGTNWFSVPVVTNNNAVIESFNILPPD